MSENTNATVTTPGEETVNGQERTFTQSELDAIVKDRLSRERGKYADYEELKAKATKFDEAEEANKTELQKAQERAESLQAQLDSINKANTLKQLRESAAKEYGVMDWLDVITGEDEETCKEQAQKIAQRVESIAQPQTYPTVKDGGEVNKVGKPTTKQSFADWWVNNALN